MKPSDCDARRHPEEHILQRMGILDYPDIAGTDAIRALSRSYICSLASKYVDSQTYVKRIDERCKNGKKGDSERPDREAHRGSGAGESESSRGSGAGQ